MLLELTFCVNKHNYLYYFIALRKRYRFGICYLQKFTITKLNERRSPQLGDSENEINNDINVTL